MTELVIIAAVAANGIIGATVDGRPVLPWRLPEDLKRFKALTSGHPVIMGRKTWESLGRPLPNRHNIVITRQPGYTAEGATTVDSLDQALAACAAAPLAFVIGGADIYTLALPLATRMELTELAADVDGDTRFPAFDRQAWREVARDSHRPDGGPEFAFVTYQRPTR